MSLGTGGRGGRGGLVFRTVASPLSELGPLDVHALYKLRVDVFVAEQNCPYAEIDEVDADPGTTHLLAWSTAPDTRSEGLAQPHSRDDLVATLRVFPTGDGDRVMHLGRMCTAPAWRGRGVAGELIRQALELCGDLPVDIGAQLYLERWYESFGFVRCGEDYLDGRIPHLPMRLDGSASRS